MKRVTVLSFAILGVLGAVVIWMDPLSAQQTAEPRLQFTKTADPPPADAIPASSFTEKEATPHVRSLIHPDAAANQEYQLHESVSVLLQKYGETENAEERSALRQRLAEFVTQQFDLRQQARENELARLEAQLRRLRAIHDRRQQEKEQIVSDRVQQLLRDADGLGWGAAGGPSDLLIDTYPSKGDVYQTKDGAAIEFYRYQSK